MRCHRNRVKTACSAYPISANSYQKRSNNLTNLAVTVVMPVGGVMKAAVRTAPAPPNAHRNPLPMQSTAVPRLTSNAQPRAGWCRSPQRGQPPCHTSSGDRHRSSARPHKAPTCAVRPARPTGRVRPGNTDRSHCRVRPRRAWWEPQAAARPRCTGLEVVRAYQSGKNAAPRWQGRGRPLWRAAPCRAETPRALAV